MIDLNVIVAVEIGIKPRTLAHLIEVTSRQILAEISDADLDGNLRTALFWPCARAVAAVGKPIVATDAVLPELHPEAFNHWRAGEPAARRSWLGVSWEPVAAHSVRKGSAP